MSSFVFPVLRGITYGTPRRPTWKTLIHEAVSGKDSSVGLQQYPVYEWEFDFELLDHSLATSELKKLEGLFNAVNGRYDTFLYTDPRFNTLVDEPFGTRDGTTTAYQIVAKFQNSGGPGAAEIIQNFNGATVIKDNGVTKTGGGVDYTLGPTGIVTWTTGGTAGHTITWSGSFYYRCRFLTDSQDFVEFMHNLYETRKIAIRQRIL